MIRAAAETFVRHRNDHVKSPLITLGISLRHRIQMSNFRGGEEHRRGIWTGGNARAAADAGGRIKRSIRPFLRNQNGICIRSAARGSANEASRLNDAVKS